MFINFYSVLTVSNLPNMLKCVLLLPSDCVYVRYCNAIISIINKNNSPVKGANRPLCGGETSWWRNVLGANRPGGESSRGRTVQMAKRPRGETSRGRTDEGAKRPVTIPLPLLAIAKQYCTQQIRLKQKFEKTNKSVKSDSN